MLTRLEHFLLGSTMDDSEPLHILYKAYLSHSKKEVELVVLQVNC